MANRGKSLPQSSNSDAAQREDEIPLSVAAKIERAERLESLGSTASVPLFCEDAHDKIEELRRAHRLGPTLRQRLYDVWYSWARNQRRRIPKGALVTKHRRKFLAGIIKHATGLAEGMARCNGDEFKWMAQASRDVPRLFYLLTELAYTAREAKDRLPSGGGRRHDPYPPNLLRELFRVFRSVGGRKCSVLSKTPTGEYDGGFYRFACDTLPLFGVIKSPSAVAKLIERTKVHKSRTRIRSSPSNSVG